MSSEIVRSIIQPPFEVQRCCYILANKGFVPLKPWRFIKSPFRRCRSILPVVISKFGDFLMENIGGMLFYFMAIVL